jgi:hypothetical protein
MDVIFLFNNHINIFHIRFTILSIIRLKSIDPIHIKQQLSMMNPETRVIVIHATSYVDSFFIYFSNVIEIRTLASIIVKQASNISLTGPEYMWIMSSIVLCNSQKMN